MAQYGRNDQAVTANSTTTKESSNGAPIGTWALVKGGTTSHIANAHFGNTSAGSRANVDSNMFANVTMGAFIPNMAVGVFGVSAKMENVVDSPLIDAQVNFHGSGYYANATVTIVGGGSGTSGVINAQANSLGYISNLNISANGSTYKEPISLTIAAPAAQTFNSNTALFSAQTINSNTALFNQVTFNGNTAVFANGTINITSQPFSVNDAVTFTTGASNTPPTGLTNNTVYFVKAANSTAVYLSATQGGAIITLTPTATVGSTGEFLTRYNFIAVATNPFANGTILNYVVAAGNTVISPLTSGNNYFVVNSNSSGFSLSNTPGGPIVNVVPGKTETGHTLTRNNFIAISSSVLQNGDRVTYLVAAGNTAIVPLANNTKYIVTMANSSGFSLAANGYQYKNNLFLTLTPGVSESGHSLTGETATGNVTLGGAASHGVTHAGWVVRREGTGGRAGRVHYETLVAMGSLGAQTSQYGTPALVANAAGVANSVFPSAN